MKVQTKGGLSDEQVERMVKEAEEMREQDAARRGLSEATANAEQTISTCKDFMLEQQAKHGVCSCLNQADGKHAEDCYGNPTLCLVDGSCGTSSPFADPGRQPGNVGFNLGREGGGVNSAPRTKAQGLNRQRPLLALKTRLPLL